MWDPKNNKENKSAGVCLLLLHLMSSNVFYGNIFNPRVRPCWIQWDLTCKLAAQNVQGIDQKQQKMCTLACHSTIFLEIMCWGKIFGVGVHKDKQAGAWMQWTFLQRGVASSLTWDTLQRWQKMPYWVFLTRWEIILASLYYKFHFKSYNWSRKVYLTQWQYSNLPCNSSLFFYCTSLDFCISIL